MIGVGVGDVVVSASLDVAVDVNVDAQVCGSASHNSKL